MGGSRRGPSAPTSDGHRSSRTRNTALDVQLLGLAATTAAKPPRPSLGRGPAAAAALVAILSGLVVLATGTGAPDGELGVPSTPSTTAVPATTRALSTTTRQSASTVQVVPPSFFVDDFAGIAEAGGLSLAVLLHGSSPGLRLVDLATGAEHAFMGPAANDGAYSASILVPIDAGVVAMSGPEAYVQQFREPAPLAVGEAAEIVPADTNSFWLVEEQQAGSDVRSAALWDLSGTVLDTVDVPPGARVVGGWRELLIVESGSGIQALTSDGPELVGRGATVSVGDGGLLVSSPCGGGLECGFEVVDLETGASRSLDLETPVGDGLVGPAAISPDGDAVAFVAFGAGTSSLLLVDLASGSVESLAVEPSYGPLVWSPDGRFLAWATYGSISIYHRATATAHVIDIAAVGFADGEGADRGLAIVASPDQLG